MVNSGVRLITRVYGIIMLTAHVCNVLSMLSTSGLLYDVGMRHCNGFPCLCVRMTLNLVGVSVRLCWDA